MGNAWAIILLLHLSNLFCCWNSLFFATSPPLIWFKREYQYLLHFSFRIMFHLNEETMFLFWRKFEPSNKKIIELALLKTICIWLYFFPNQTNMNIFWITSKQTNAIPNYSLSRCRWRRRRKERKSWRCGNGWSWKTLGDVKASLCMHNPAFNTTYNDYLNITWHITTATCVSKKVLAKKNKIKTTYYILHQLYYYPP